MDGIQHKTSEPGILSRVQTFAQGATNYLSISLSSLNTARKVALMTILIFTDRARTVGATQVGLSNTVSLTMLQHNDRFGAGASEQGFVTVTARWAQHRQYVQGWNQDCTARTEVYPTDSSFLATAGVGVACCQAKCIVTWADTDTVKVAEWEDRGDALIPPTSPISLLPQRANYRSVPVPVCGNGWSVGWFHFDGSNTYQGFYLQHLGSGEAGNVTFFGGGEPLTDPRAVPALASTINGVKVHLHLSAVPPGQSINRISLGPEEVEFSSTQPLSGSDPQARKRPTVTCHPSNSQLCGGWWLQEFSPGIWGIVGRLFDPEGPNYAFTDNITSPFFSEKTHVSASMGKNLVYAQAYTPSSTNARLALFALGLDGQLLWSSEDISGGPLPKPQHNGHNTALGVLENSGIVMWSPVPYAGAGSAAATCFTASNFPTRSPTQAPTSSPTAAPTSTPSALPTSNPTVAPTSSPTAVPTSSPTVVTTTTGSTSTAGRNEATATTTASSLSSRVTTVLQAQEVPTPTAEDGPPVAAIAGGTVGGISVCVIAAIGAGILIRRNRKSSPETPEDAPADTRTQLRALEAASAALPTRDHHYASVEAANGHAGGGYAEVPAACLASAALYDRLPPQDGDTSSGSAAPAALAAMAHQYGPAPGTSNHYADPTELFVT